MTDNQLQYSYNAKQSKILCLQLERLLEDADFNEKCLNVHSHEICIYQIKEIEAELDKIWDEQVDLFFKIQLEHSKHKTEVFMESIRPNFKKSKSTFDSKHY
jgi:hypothetical protein